MTQAELKGQWENEKGVINVVRDLKGGSSRRASS